MEEFEDIKAFKILWKALDDEEIKSFSYKSDTGIFLIDVAIGNYTKSHSIFEDYDYRYENIELEAEEILNGELNKEIEKLELDYYKECLEAWEEENGVPQPLLKHYYANGELCTDYL